jgi:hypothetical protein
MRVSKNQRAPGADVIDIPVAIDIPQVSTPAAVDEDRLAPDGAKCSRRAVYAARHKLLSVLK